MVKKKTGKKKAAFPNRLRSFKGYNKKVSGTMFGDTFL